MGIVQEQLTSCPIEEVYALEADRLRWWKPHVDAYQHQLHAEVTCCTLLCAPQSEAACDLAITCTTECYCCVPAYAAAYRYQQRQQQCHEAINPSPS
jgi:hypothetical protein